MPTEFVGAKSDKLLGYNVSKPMGLLAAGFNYANAAQDEFNDWYNTEHLPRLSAVPGCLCARRFRAQGGTRKYLAIYHLASPEICSSKA